MTVEQYLKIYNNIPDEKPLPEFLPAIGFYYLPLCLVPEGINFHYKRNSFGGIGDEHFIIRRGRIKLVYSEWDGQCWRPLSVSKGVRLKDDISLHCGSYDTVEDLIKAAIKWLESTISSCEKGYLLSNKLTVEDFEMATDRFRSWLDEKENIDDSPKHHR